MERSLNGGASILAIGTANPAHCIHQADFPDFYFSVTNTYHISPLFRAKFKRICEKSGIKKRYVQLTEEILKENDGIRSHTATSLNQRQDIAISETPKLAKEAAQKAIDEWGRPTSDITHLIMCTYSRVDMPGADYHLAKLLGLRPSVNRIMIYQQGGPAILDHVEAKLRLEPNKLGATRQVLNDYGNMSSASVLFVLDEMRKKSVVNGNATTGEGLEWGVLFGFGPGITVETVVLRSVPITK